MKYRIKRRPSLKETHETKKNIFTLQHKSSNNLEYSTNNKCYLEEEENYKQDKYSTNSHKQIYSQVKINPNISHFNLKEPRYEHKSGAKIEKNFRKTFLKVNPRTYHNRSNSLNVLF